MGIPAGGGVAERGELRRQRAQEAGEEARGTVVGNGQAVEIGTEGLGGAVGERFSVGNGLFQLVGGFGPGLGG